MPLTIQPTPFRAWSALQAQLSTYDHNWAFRGMGSAEWFLQTSLERLLVSGVIPAERYLLTAFQRRAHHHVRDCPKADDYLEWLALMQHHGTPTRLLDCTRSPYVALFFALERSPSSQLDQVAVWAIDIEACKQAALRVLAPTIGVTDASLSLGVPEMFQKAFMGEHDTASAPVALCVAPIQPFRMNERLNIQQGLFLCPSRVSMGFEENLQAMSMQGTAIQKLTFSASLREEILAELNKMNINRASLFPGIDGFAQSLAVNVQIATHKGKLSQEIQRLDAYAEYGF